MSLSKKNKIEYKLKMKVLKRINAARMIQRVFRNTTQCTICIQLVQKKWGYCHTFHDSCREKWIGMGKTNCPTCRGELPLALQHKKQYFIDSSKLLKELKQSIEFWDPNYFDENEFTSWNRKILLAEYYIEIITNGSIAYKAKISPMYKNCYDKMDMAIEGTNRKIEDLTDYLEELKELNKIIL